MPNSQQIEEIKRLTLYWKQQAEAILKRPLPLLEIRFDLRGRAAGQFRSQPKPCIRYNMQIACRQFEAFCLRTPPHEVAHFAVYEVYGRKVRPHGQEWKALMNAFGCDASATHDFDLEQVTVRRQKRYSYRCACRVHLLSATRHNRVMRDDAEYRCRACGERLRLE